jgi:hypothetical protein
MYIQYIHNKNTLFLTVYRTGSVLNLHLGIEFTNAYVIMIDVFGILCYG